MLINSLLITAIVLVTGLLLWALGFVWRLAANQQYVSPTSLIILRGGSRLLVLGIATIVCLRIFGVHVDAILASVSALLLVIAVGFFAVWSVLSNIFCAGLLLFYGSFRIGDEIELLEPGKDFWIRGKVTSINLFFVTIIEAHADGSESINRIPNNLIMQKVVRRWPGEKTHSLAQAMSNRHRTNSEAGKAGKPANTNPDPATKNSPESPPETNQADRQTENQPAETQ